jgi:hypothetical protein
MTGNLSMIQVWKMRMTQCLIKINFPYSVLSLAESCVLSCYNLCLFQERLRLRVWIHTYVNSSQ